MLEAQGYYETLISLGSHGLFERFLSVQTYGLHDLERRDATDLVPFDDRRSNSARYCNPRRGQVRL